VKQFAIVIGLIFALGCATNATTARKGFTTISDATAGATAAMKAFNDRYQAGLQTEADRTLALGAWVAFQGLAHSAEVIAKDPNRTADPVAVASDAAAQLIAFIATLTQKKSELPLPFFWPIADLAWGGAL
jgi:hypothetical protein